MTIEQATYEVSDRMQQVVMTDLDTVDDIFRHGTPGTIRYANLLDGGTEALREFNASEKL